MTVRMTGDCEARLPAQAGEPCGEPVTTRGLAGCPREHIEVGWFCENHAEERRAFLAAGRMLLCRRCREMGVWSEVMVRFDAGDVA